MGTGSINSELYKRGYTSPEMETIWDEKHVIQAILDVEAAFSETQSNLGMIPKEAAQSIRKAAVCSPELEQKALNGDIGNPLVASLDALRSQVPKDAVGWVHFGATTQDILDTARATQIKQSNNLIGKSLNDLISKTTSLSHKYAKTLMVARTNGKHALPTTLGMRFARWNESLKRARNSFNECRPRCEMIQFSGAVGTYASMGKYKTKVAESLAKQLGLTFEVIPWHSSRESITELCCDLAIIAQVIDKIAQDLFDMQTTDLSEAREIANAHASGSSTMPQKVNPFSTMRLTVNARLCEGLASSVLLAPTPTFERDFRHTEIERNAVPQIYISAHACITKLNQLLDRMVFDENAMMENLKHEGPLLLTEHIMMELASHIGQEKAHDILQAYAKEYRENHIKIQDYLSNDPDTKALVKDIDWDNVLDPKSYIGLSAYLSENISE